MPVRAPQPPIDRYRRSVEAHDFWVGAVVAVIGILVLAGGLVRVTGLETLDGDAAWETQLVRAFAVGGLKYTLPAAPTSDRFGQASTLGPRSPDGPDSQPGIAQTRRARVRVDTGATTPCPT